MRGHRALSKDHYAGALMIAIGLGVLGIGAGYHVGNLNRMGAGYIPVVLGVLMIAIGIVIAATAARVAGPVAAAGGGHGLDRRAGPQWRGWLCIIGGVAAFVVIGQYGGMLPATFAAVFVAAMGDRDNTPKTAAALAALMAVFALVIFHFGLKVQLPLFGWG